MRRFVTGSILTTFVAGAVTLALSGQDTSRSGSSDPSSANVQLRMVISIAPQQEAGGRVTFRVALENASGTDVVLNLGRMLGNGRVHVPDAIRMRLTDATGQSRELHFVDRKYPGVAGRIDDYVLPLRAGSSYKFTANLDDYWSPETKEHQFFLAAGKYRIRSEFVGTGAKHVNADTQGVELLHFWKGKLRSSEIEFVVKERGRL